MSCFMWIWGQNQGSPGLVWIHDADDNVPLNLPETQWTWSFQPQATAAGLKPLQWVPPLHLSSSPRPLGSCLRVSPLGLCLGATGAQRHAGLGGGEGAGSSSTGAGRSGDGLEAMGEEGRGDGWEWHMVPLPVGSMLWGRYLDFEAGSVVPLQVFHEAPWALRVQEKSARSLVLTWCAVVGHLT